MTADSDAEQESADRFYWSHGPCCAGCDWWARVNSITGECRRNAPVAEAERWAMAGIIGCSLLAGAGHKMTPRAHICGDFKDTFDWASLPASYRRRIGVRNSNESR